jgi:succinyl-CoA synthetase beta subunit
MQVHEFQAKKVLSRYGIAVPAGATAETAEEAEAAAVRLGPGTLFVKAQVLSGDRAAAGGVRRVASPAEARAAAAQLLGRSLVTAQTGHRGRVVGKLLIERGADAQRELYLALHVDPASASIIVTCGPGGAGVERDIGALARLSLGASGERRQGDIAGFAAAAASSDLIADKLAAVIGHMHRALVDHDATLIEINPLLVTTSGELVAADAKVEFDDNAVFRHPDMAELGGREGLNHVELKAQHHQINYIGLDGDIGTIVNGAGLGLATLDMIRVAGGSPANFMDIRTTARSLDVAQGVCLVLDNPRAKVLLVNVFGGGMQPCDTIAEGVGIAFRKHARRLPLVLRVAGNNEELARLRFANFDLPKIACDDMWQAATRAVAVAQGRA